MEDGLCSSQVPDNSSLLRELFEASDETSLAALTQDQEYSFTKPQLSTVNISYINNRQIFTGSPIRPGISKHIDFITLFQRTLLITIK